MNTIKILSVILLIISIESNICSGNISQYPVSHIPLELLENSNSVIRCWDITFNVIDKGHAIKTEHKVITILNKYGDERANFIQPYSKLIKIKNYGVNIFDSQGKQIKKVSQSEFKDYSSAPEYILYSDNRVLIYQPQINIYPYTIEFDIEIEDNNLLFYPLWHPQNEFEESVQSSSMKLILPKDLGFNFKSNRLTDSVQITTLNNKKEYLWKSENLKALEKEYFSTGTLEITPNLILAPKDFEVHGIYGNCDTWKELGAFIFNLMNGKNKLSDKTANEVRSIIKNEADKSLQVKLIYEYMQNKTRYVAVEVGLGGWKPHDASEVDKLGYGDCKDLSNYMKSLLDVVGINSVYTIIKAGKNEINLDMDFPRSTFNHATLFVPLEKDTIWLECTDQKTPCGFTGSFTSNRYGLAITAEGGFLVRTPVLKKSDNSIHRNVEIKISETGMGVIKAKTQYTGICFSNVEHLFYLSSKEKERRFKDNFTLSNFKIENIKYELTKAVVPKITESFDLISENHCTLTGKRMFVSANYFNQSYKIPPKEKNRKTGFTIHWSEQEMDTIVYIIPSNFSIEFMPESKEINSEFGTYKTIYTLSENKLINIIKITQNGGEFSSMKYSDYVEFCEQISQINNYKITLIKKME